MAIVSLLTPLMLGGKGDGGAQGHPLQVEVVLGVGGYWPERCFSVVGIESYCQREQRH